VLVNLQPQLIQQFMRPSQPNLLLTAIIDYDLPEKEKGKKEGKVTPWCLRPPRPAG
jgi:hypothetical protein